MESYRLSLNPEIVEVWFNILVSEKVIYCLV